MHLLVIYAVGGQGSIIVRPWRLGLVDFTIYALHAQPPPQAHARPPKTASSNPWRGTSMVSPVDQPPPGVRWVNWSTIAVSPAFWPPIRTTDPPRNVTAPPPLVARGRSGSRDQVDCATSKQSTRAVVG